MSIFKFKFMTAFLFLAMLLQQGNSQAFSGYAQAQKSIYKNVFDKKRLELIVKNICEKKYLILAGASGVIFLGIAVVIIKKLFPGNPGDPVKPSDPVGKKLEEENLKTGKNLSGVDDNNKHKEKKTGPWKFDIDVYGNKTLNIGEEKKEEETRVQDFIKIEDVNDTEKEKKFRLEKENQERERRIIAQEEARLKKEQEEKEIISIKAEFKDLKPENTVPSVLQLITPEGPVEKSVNNLEIKKEEQNCSKILNIKKSSHFKTETQELNELIKQEGFESQEVIRKDSFVKVEQKETKETKENTIDGKKQEEELEKFTEQELERQELEKKKIKKKKIKKDESVSCDLDDFVPENSSFEYYEIKGNNKKKLTCDANNEEELKELAGKYKLLDKPTKVACLIFIKDQSKDVREKFELFKNK